MVEKVFENLYNPSIVSDTDNANRFGEWIIKQPCCRMREIINKLDGLSKNYSKNYSKNPQKFTKLNENSKLFLQIFNHYYKAHKFLVKNMSESIHKIIK
jgi:hypothetical protein